MSASAIVGALQSNVGLRERMGIFGWAQEQQRQAALVKKYRQYYDGDHDVKLSTQMKKMLRESDANSPFSANYCELVVDKMTDRLLLQSVVADNDLATKWATEVLNANRLDALQTSVHESTVKDGNTFVLVDWLPADGGNPARVRFTHEPAFDGTQGMVVLYERTNSDAPTLAMKIWYETQVQEGVADKPAEITDKARVTVYYADRIERYQQVSGAMQPVMSSTDLPGQPGVQRNMVGRVPVIHFRNKGTQVTNTGRSELRAAIPLQNVLNRTLVSMVMTSELTAFQIHIAKNFVPPDTVSPGGWIQIEDPDEEGKKKAEADTLPAGEIVPFVEQANWAITQIATVTSTPLPGFEQSGESGEAKKQREEGLLGKVRRAHTDLGNAWEDVLMLAWSTQAAYGKQPPAYNVFTAKWGAAEIRNNAEVIANANAVRDFIPRVEYFRILAPVFGWTEDKVQELAQQAQLEEQARAANLGVPMFGAAA